VETAARAGVDWFVWRLVTSERIPDGLVEIRRRWSCWDCIEGHIALDALDRLDEIARAEADASRPKK
jgi:hypothetical protein